MLDFGFESTFWLCKKVRFPTAVFACLADTLHSNYLICNLEGCVTVKTVQLVLLRNIVTLY